jgi:ribosomal protein S27AE
MTTICSNKEKDKILDELQDCNINNYKYNTKLSFDTIFYLQELVKRDKRLEPIKKTYQVNDNPLTFHKHVCPYCGGAIMLHDKSDGEEYCPYCGQYLDMTEVSWDE